MSVQGGYKVGEYGFICVGLGGTVEAVGDGTVTIEGTTMPRRMSEAPGLRYLSSEPPPWPIAEAKTCEDCRVMQQEMERESARWVNLIRAEHEEHHADPWVICQNALCRAVNEW